MRCFDLLRGLAFIGLLCAALQVRDAGAAQRSRSEAEMCTTAEWIFVGKVLKRDSNYDPRPDVYISSRVTLKVEAVALGEPPPVVRFGILGGVVEDQRNVVEDQPVAEVGSRYLILGRLIDVSPGSGIRDRIQLDNVAASSQALKLIRFYKLNPDARLPPSAEMQEIWREHCQPAALKGQTQRPTQKYLQYIPQSLIDWCEHY